MRLLHGADPRVPARRRAGAGAVDAQVVGHADPGHAPHADGALAARLRPRPARDRLVRGPTSIATCWNTVVIAFGSWAIQLVVATTAGFALSVLRPRFSGLLTGLVIATLFVPPIVLLVPLYLTIVDVPIVHVRMIDSYWAIWLPAGASAVNVDPDQAVLRQPAAGDLRGGPGRRRRAVPALLVDRPADVAADPRGRLGLRGDRDVEGLSLAAARHPQPGPPAAVGPAADAPADDRPRGRSSPR